MKTGKLIGLFFGSFNPIHTGHLIIAHIFAEHTDLDQVWFVVTPQNPHKSSKSLLHEFDRYDMVKAAIADQWNLDVIDIEFNLPKPNYTIHTLSHLREKFPKNKFRVIMGADNLASFTKWKNYQQILTQYGLYVYPRMQASASPLLNHPNVQQVEAPILNISATFIRACVKQQKSIQYLVPEPVEKLIKQNQYYT